MGLDGFTNLDAAQRRLGHITSGVTHGQLKPVGEAQGVGVGVDVRHHEAIAVLVQLVGQVEEVVALGQLLDNAFYIAARQLLFVLDAGLRRLLARNLDGLQVQIARCASQALDRDAAHRDLLHQLLVVGVQRIQAVNLVVRRPVRG